MAPAGARGSVLSPCRPRGGASGVGLADPEVLSCPLRDADTLGTAGALNGPKQTGGGATTGTRILPGTNARDADGDNLSRLPYFGRGTQEAATR
ncbi:hypothetical protein NDU88_005577 [Pleurodeles waltl]|uniref:Uncharacterized protein n=1 Tax=Pleurodeles waltl TaxID=8319 RepID=A0AAV7TUC5_PLEWA|nr:hypothetical protein NDU88_005577 [Pleurodeles waltl]